MSAYAIQNKSTGKFVSSTDIMNGFFAIDFKDSYAAMLFKDRYMAELFMHSRQCGEEYHVVEVEPLKVVD